MTTRYGDLRRVLRSDPSAKFVWHVAGALSVATTLDKTEYADKKLRLVKAVAIVETAPTDATLIVDIHVDGTTIFGAGTKLVVADAATRGVQSTIASPNVAAGSILTIDVDQVGSTAAGADLTVHLYVEPL